ncbi:MAG: D-aminoacylase [Bacillota bacterium]
MYDIKISGAVVVDGSGSAGVAGEVLVAGDQIAAVRRRPTGEPARETVDGDGLVVCPGFIDLHSHSDFTLFSYPRAESKVHQGVTTELVGNCGIAPYPVSASHREDLHTYIGEEGGKLPWSWSDLGGYLKALQTAGAAVNVAPLAAHGSIRIAVMGFDERSPSPDEMEDMKRFLRTDLADGAFGMSTGLIYAPGTYSCTGEITSLAREMTEVGGMYVSHIRGESEGLLDAVDEALQIGRGAEVPVHIAHLKAAGRAVWGFSEKVVRMMQRAVSAGQDVTGDAYPYLGGSTSLAALLPPWTLNEGMPGLVQRLRSTKQRRRIARDIERGVQGWWNPVRAAGGWESVMITEIPEGPNVQLRGLRVTEIAGRRGGSPLDAACDLLVQEEGRVSMIIFMMHEGDVRTYLAADRVAVGSDGAAVAPGDGLVHPRSYGTFPRVLARYVREEKLLSLPGAIYKMTGLPARRLGLTDRGLLRPGQKADLVLFSPDQIRDTATYDSPHSYPDGIELVAVNGRVVVRGGRHTGALPGRVLRRG